MRAATGWRDFGVLDASDGEKLERLSLIHI